MYKKRGDWNREKRGQTTTFIVIGLLLLITTGMVFFIRNLYFTATDGAIEKIGNEITTLPPLKTYVQQCIVSSSQNPIKEIGIKGRYFNDTINTFLRLKPNFHGKEYPTLCDYQEDYGCVNYMLSREWMEKQLEIQIKPALRECVNFTLFERIGYAVTNGTISVDVTIAVDEVIVQAEYPITITKIDDVQEEKIYQIKLNSPLGRVYDLVNNITNSELVSNHFNKNIWMLQHGSEITIDKHKAIISNIPFILYDLKYFDELNNDTFEFLFSLEEQDRINKIGDEIRFDESTSKTCFSSNYANCFENAPAGLDCAFFGYSDTGSCGGHTVYNTGKENIASCYYNSVQIPHGRSWCLSEAPGIDNNYLPGSRFYVASCIGGNVYIEECSDYRQEFCVYDPSQKIHLFEFNASISSGQKNFSITGNAECRPNRWQDCISQESKSDCENINFRDCRWDEPSIPGNKQIRPICVPQVPAGFKFWEMQGMEICEFGNDYRTCDGSDMSCPYSWTSALDQRCRYLGDCGASYNVNKMLSEGGFFSTDDRIYSKSGGYSETTGLRYSEPKQDVYENPLGNKISFNRKQKSLTGSEYEKNSYTYTTMIEFISRYIDEAGAWDMCGDWFKCIEIFGIKIPTKYIGHVIAASMCLPWQAPAGITGNDCDYCGKYEDQFPCTEYKCKSLGEACNYHYDFTEGKGMCSRYSTDVNKFNITFVGFKNGLNHTEDDYMMSSVASMGYMGIMTNETSAPNQRIDFAFNTSENTSCMMLPFPPSSMATSSMPSVPFLAQRESKYSKYHEMSIILPEYGDIMNGTMDALNISDMLEMNTYLDDLNEFFLDQPRVRDALNDAGNSNGPNAQQALDNFSKLRNDYSQAFSLTSDLLTELMVSEPTLVIYTFIMCQTTGGVFNNIPINTWFGNSLTYTDETPYFEYIKLVIEDHNSTEPPKIVDTVPKNISTIFSEMLTLKVYTDKPAECRISRNATGKFFHNNNGFLNIMGGDTPLTRDLQKMTCSRGGLNVIDGNYCTIKINSSLAPGESGNYYIKCRDNPVVISDYGFQVVNKSGLLGAVLNQTPVPGNNTYITLNATSGNLSIRNSFFINNQSEGSINATVIHMDPAAVLDVNVKRSKPSQCYLENNNKIFWEETDSTSSAKMWCNDDERICSTVQGVVQVKADEYNANWHIKCVNKEDQFAKHNLMVDPYVFNITRIS